MTLEEICRRLLKQAVEDHLVLWSPDDCFAFDLDSPLELSAGDVCGMANLLNKLLTEMEAEDDLPSNAQA